LIKEFPELVDRMNKHWEEEAQTQYLLKQRAQRLAEEARQRGAGK
jgi:hypothetical protein